MLHQSNYSQSLSVNTKDSHPLENIYLLFGYYQISTQVKTNPKNMNFNISLTLKLSPLAVQPSTARGVKELRIIGVKDSLKLHLS